jgi:hypothetical protein
VEQFGAPRRDEQRPENADATTESGIRTAVVFIHGKGETEYRPNETLDGFAKSALPPVDGRWEQHYSRAPLITGSYEARVYVAPSPDGRGATDFYEYHWQYLATASRFAGVILATLRLVLRRPSNVPDSLYGIWRACWLGLLAAICIVVPLLSVLGYFLGTEFPIWVVGLVVSVFLIGGVGLLTQLLSMLLYSAITTSVIDVARYLDPWMRSHAARRAIRGGLVDLLHDLHDEGRYARIVVVAHGVGSYIGYDALSALWDEYHELRAGPSTLDALPGVEAAAARLPAALDDFQDSQFALWKDLRRQGNPWRITDFVTVGAPLALADLFVVRPGLFSGFRKDDAADRRGQLDDLVRRGLLARCPPRGETQPVEGPDRHPAAFGGVDGGLGAQALFAVTRWTNLWFPVVRGHLPGDWFGGILQPLFGPGVRDVLVTGNVPARLARGTAHNAYFDHPDAGAEGDLAWHLRATLALHDADALDELATAPPPDRATRARRAHHRCWRSDSWLLE